MAPQALTASWGGCAGVAERGARARTSRADTSRPQGLVVLARNYRCRSGEIDIVARDGDATVFVEVKERRADVPRRRATRPSPTASASGSSGPRGSTPPPTGSREAPLRFDVVSIDWEAEATPASATTAGAFDAEGR